MVLDCLLVVVRVCRLCLAPWYWWVRWQGLVVVLGVSLVRVVVWRSSLHRIRRLACRPRLRCGVVMMELVGVALVFGHRGGGIWGGSRVLVLLLVPPSLALRERRPLCGVEL